MFSTIWDMLKHNKFIVTSVIVSILIVIYAYGCQPSTVNPFNPSQKVTRAQLDADVQKYVADVKIAYADIQRQEQVRDALVNAGLAYTQGEGVSPVGVAATILGILGIGAVVDNRVKDTVIASKTNALNSINSSLGQNTT